MSSIFTASTANIFCDFFTSDGPEPKNVIIPLRTSAPSVPATGSSAVYSLDGQTINFMYANGNVINFSLGGGVNGIYAPPTASGTLVSKNATQTLTNKNISSQNLNTISASSLNGIPISVNVPSNGQYISYNGSSWIPQTFTVQPSLNFWLFGEQVSAGTNGASLVSGYNTRSCSLISTQSSTSSNVTNPSANVIRFTPGFYRVQCIASLRANSGSELGNSQLTLSAAGTPTTIYVYGQSTRNVLANTNTGMTIAMTGTAMFYTTTDCNIYHYISTTLTNGAGLATGIGLETYLSMYIEQL